MPSLSVPLTLLLLFFITSCTSRFAVVSDTDNQALDLWRQHQSQIVSIQSWELKGKIGVKTGTGKRGGSATLKWTYVSDDQEIELYGPFGGGRVIINAQKDNAVLRDTKGKEIKGNSAEEVLYERLGWRVPFNELVMWSRGLPNEGADNLEFDQRGFLKSLDEGIWHVEYQEYQTISEYTLPRKLTITSVPGALEIYDDDGNYIGDTLNVKVILKRWWDIKSETG